MSLRATIALILLLPGLARGAQFRSAAKGSSAANFLKMGVGARAVALGEAYSAMADDATALYWNPAALNRIEKRAATFMHGAYVESSYFDYGSYAQNLNGYGAFGLGIAYFNAGSLAETDASGTDIGSFTPYDLALSMGYARELNFVPGLEGASLGIGMKFIQSHIISTSETWAMDLGILSPACFDGRLRLGLSMLNLGGKLKFDDDAERLPLMIRVGSAYKVSESFGMSLDVAAPSDNKPNAALGAEYLWRPMKVGPALAGRIGFNSRTLGEVDGFSGLALGFGVVFNNSSVDYGFVPLGGLGQAHRISTSIKF